MFLLRLSNEELKKFLIKNGYKQFQAKQIFEWVYKKYVSSFDEMKNLSLKLRELLKENFDLYSLKLVDIQSSKNEQTKKYLFKLPDGYLIEAVLILSHKIITVCLSTQVGCKVKCSFCASGKKGFFRNLESNEIIEQILNITKDLKIKPTHVVFMGMGESLMNLSELLKAIGILSSKDYLNISQRKITISTVGILENLKKLKEKNLKVNLALSLHASTDEIRHRIIPYSRRYKLKGIIDELKGYFEKTKRDISFEYILLENINDSINDAKNLVSLIKNMQCSVNLIPYNHIESINYTRPSNSRINKFKQYLEDKKINVSQRYTKGDDIAAACGQLACAKENNLLKFDNIN